jgi:hypothetical protein
MEGRLRFRLKYHFKYVSPVADLYSKSLSSALEPIDLAFQLNMSVSSHKTERNARSIGSRADESDLLYKSATGDTYLKWYLSLKRSLPSHSSRHVQEHGMEVIEDTAVWEERFKRRLQIAKDENNEFEKKVLYDQMLARESAARTIFYLIPSRLSDEVRDIVEMSEEFKILSIQEKMNVHALLQLVKKTVSVGVAANPTYQCYLAMRHLFDTVQKPDEDIRKPLTVELSFGHL